MRKGIKSKRGYKDNYDAIDFSGVRKNRQGLMGSKTRVHGDRKAKHTKKIHQEEIDDAI